MTNTKEKDILNRQYYVDHIKNILSTLSQNKKNCSFALDGEWGSGKSFVLNMLEEQIKDDYLIIRYNAWENDFYEEPLIAILYTFANKLNDLQKTDNIVNGLKKELLSKIANGFLSIVGQIIKTKIGVDVVELGRKGLKKAKEFKKHIEKIEDKEKIDTSFDQNANLQVIIKQIISGLRELAENYPIVVLVDELDRCLPEYSIKVLERLHHVFNDVDNLQVILSIDKEQLSNAVAKIYNLANIGMHKSQNDKRTYFEYINSYYKKFFSFEIYLNEGKLNEEKFHEKIAEYESLFTSNSIINENDVKDYLEMIFSDFTIREKINIIEKSNLIHNLIVTDNANLDISYMYMEILLVVKQEQKIEKYKPSSYSQEIFGVVVDHNKYFNVLKNKMTENMNMSNGRVQQNLNNSKYLFELTDLWCFLWFALLIVSPNYSNWVISDYSNYKEYEEHFQKFSSLLKVIK
ncbi:MAG: hypothetical protein E7346_07190 [Clostridiales bacterium]|nr:hypothetical protein [Clostridiales bacterium]